MTVLPPGGPAPEQSGLQSGFGELRGGNLGVRIATTPDEIDAVQALRYRVFYEELGAGAGRGCARGPTATATHSTPSPTICWWSTMRSARGRRAWSAPTG